MDTYCTDAHIDATDRLARTALQAFSDGAVARGEPAVTDYADLRAEARRQLLIDLAARNITEAQITTVEGLVVVEVARVLASLFGAVGQWSAGVPDVYASKAAWYEDRYRRAVATVNVRAAQRPAGATFGWGRG